ALLASVAMSSGDVARTIQVPSANAKARGTVTSLGPDNRSRPIRVVVANGPGAGARLAKRLAAFEEVEIIDVAVDGAGSFGLIEAARADIVVVDLGLGQALELIAQLRERLPSVHIVAHLALASERLAEAALADGATRPCSKRWTQGSSTSHPTAPSSRPTPARRASWGSRVRSCWPGTSSTRAGSPSGRTAPSGPPTSGRCPWPCARASLSEAPSTACAGTEATCAGCR